MRDYLELGPVPPEEECQQVGTSSYDDKKAREECERYKELLEKKFPTAQFGIKKFHHDFGSYREVVVYFDDTEEDPIAFEVDRNLPMTWEPLEEA